MHIATDPLSPFSLTPLLNKVFWRDDTEAAEGYLLCNGRKIWIQTVRMSDATQSDVSVSLLNNVKWKMWISQLTVT